MEHRKTTPAELLSDSAVYQRTRRGQRELLRADATRTTPALRVLARVNGFTDLRQLVELSPSDTREIARSIQELFADDLIELVEQEPPQLLRRSTF